ncbi:MAG: alpha/beta hydrolase [Bacteroidales bacterium]
MDIKIEIPGIPELNGIIDRSEKALREVIILVHGLGEHAGRYDEWCNRFIDRGYNMVRIDLPGHGGVGRKRGHIKSFRTNP